jgi:O-antigen ligase
LNGFGKLSKKFWHSLQRHPSPELQSSWNWAQLAFVILPFSTLLGSFGILFATIALWKLRSQLFLRRPVTWGFILFTLLLGISAAFSPRPVDAFLGLFNFVPFFLGFVVLGELIQTPAQLRQLAWIATWTSVPVALIGILQMLLGWFGHQQPLHFQVLWIVADWNIDPRGTPTGRMSSIFFYANVLASYLVMSLALAMGLWMEGKKEEGRGKKKEGSQEAEGGRWKAEEIQNPKSKIQNPKSKIQNPKFPTPHSPKPWLLAIVLLDAIALILTNSRNAWAIAAISCFVLAVYHGWRWLLTAVSAISGSILIASFGASPVRDWFRKIIPAFFWARLTDELYPNRPVATLRTTQWQFALSLTQQRPWTGWGLRSFSPLYEAQTQYQLGHPHNLLLMLLCETGILATLVLMGLVGWIVLQAILWLRGSMTQRQILATQADGSILRPERSPDRAIVFTFLATFLSCAGFSLFDITLFDARINWLGWMLLAGIWGATRSPKP